MIKNFILIACILLRTSVPILASPYCLETLERRIIESRVKLDQGSLHDINIVKEHLALMVELDQDVRNLFNEDINNPIVRTLLQDIDRFNTNHLKAILEIYLWINISKFGKEADNRAWVIVQHAAHDPEFQLRCLAILEKLLPLDETDKNNYAFLYDRTASIRGLKQRYGTQAYIENNQLTLLPYEGSLTDLNKRRFEIGLEPVEVYIETLKRVYKIK